MHTISYYVRDLRQEYTKCGSEGQLGNPPPLSPSARVVSICSRTSRTVFPSSAPDQRPISAARSKVAKTRAKGGSRFRCRSRQMKS